MLFANALSFRLLRLICIYIKDTVYFGWNCDRFVVLYKTICANSRHCCCCVELKCSASVRPFVMCQTGKIRWI